MILESGQRPEWQSKGTCAKDPNLKVSDFYAGHLNLARLRVVCHSCPVKQECREWADVMSPSWGFFAGETVKERSWRRKNPGKRLAKL